MAQKPIDTQDAHLPPVEAAQVEPVVSANKHTKQPKVAGTEAAS